jgi:hypothetical protein
MTALESWAITPTCRFNRGNDGAWQEAVDQLRQVYDAQVQRFGPTATLTLSLTRGRAIGVLAAAYQASAVAAVVQATPEQDTQPTEEDPGFCPRDHGCSLPAGHDGDCSLTAALCFCPECEKRADERDTQ